MGRALQGFSQEQGKGVVSCQPRKAWPDVSPGGSRACHPGAEVSYCWWGTSSCCHSGPLYLVSDQCPLEGLRARAQMTAFTLGEGLGFVCTCDCIYASWAVICPSLLLG